MQAQLLFASANEPFQAFSFTSFWSLSFWLSNHLQYCNFNFFVKMITKNQANVSISQLIAYISFEETGTSKRTVHFCVIVSMFPELLLTVHSVSVVKVLLHLFIRYFKKIPHIKLIKFYINVWTDPLQIEFDDLEPLRLPLRSLLWRLTLLARCSTPTLAFSETCPQNPTHIQTCMGALC